MRTAYDTLGLQTYFTSGPTETRAWTIRKGSTAPQVNTKCDGCVIGELALNANQSRWGTSMSGVSACSCTTLQISVTGSHILPFIHILTFSMNTQAAGVIHSDFEKGFIRAETISYDDLVRLGSEKAVKEAGLLRSEGKDYVMQEGDVVLFRFNV